MDVDTLELTFRRRDRARVRLQVWMKKFAEGTYQVPGHTVLLPRGSSATAVAPGAETNGTSVKVKDVAEEQLGRQDSSR